MAFLRSLFAGVSGLRNHQVMMDVIGNNIANINTIGFKGSRTTFSETFAQSLRSASRPSATNGGTNPMQVGLGTAIATIDTFFGQGNLESTGSETDLAIKGNAFFAVNKGSKTYYTRVGSFQFDALGRLVHPGTGAILQGKIAGADGTLPTGTRLEDLRIALDQKSPARATTEVELSGNLNAAATVREIELAGNVDSATAVGGTVTTTLDTTDEFGASHTLTVTLTKTAADTWSYAVAGTDGTIAGGAGTITFGPTGRVTSVAPPDLRLTPANGAPEMSLNMAGAGLTQITGANSLAAELSTVTDSSSESFLTVYDSLGNSHTLSVRFTKTDAPNVWTWSANIGAPATVTGGQSGRITFNAADGTLASFTYSDGSGSVAIDPNNGAAPMNVDLNPGNPGVFAGITQANGNSMVSSRSQDGYAAGDLNGITIEQTGRIVGNFTNSTVLVLGQVMLVEFTNPSGLQRVGDNMFDITGNAGSPVVVSAGDTSRSTIQSNALEQSNVDLSEEFTRMITAQRGFQSNARVITTSDEFLNEVVNLKR